LAGSFDSKIRAYDPISSEEKASYVGHAQCVSALACNNKTQTVVSGSWDKNVKVWKGKWGSPEKKCAVTISGQHEGSVLAIGLLEDDRIITGCADKLLRIFNAEGKIIKTLQGHTDVIQSLTILPDERLLSTGNDMKIRLWNLKEGSIEKEFAGHTGFIYCVSLMPRNKGFITSGEDRSVRVWSWDSSEPTETIMLPAQSAWACTALTMGDIAVSLSDGTVRVFTYRERFQAPAEEVAAFEESVAAMKIPAKALEDKMDVSKLPRSLPTAGKKEGATIMINEPSGVVAYQWTKGSWEKIGDVTGVSDKEKFGDKEYDFVFSVDVEEGRPALKLPYNLTEDPWRAAQKFINNNALPLTYLEEVANFIISNTAEARERQAVQVVEPGVVGGADPLTGGSGYRPDYTAPTSRTQTKKGGAADPFTGSGAYTPDDIPTGPNAPRYLPGDGTSSASTKPRMENPEDNPGRYVPDAGVEETPKYNIVFVDKKFFPEEKYLFFDDPAPGVDKIVNMFSKKCFEKGIEIEEEQLKTLSMLCDPESVLTADDIFVYFMVQMKTHEFWDIKFPLIDILRLAMLNYSVVGLLCHEDRVKEFLRPLMRQLQVEKPAAVQLLTMRCFVNLFRHEIGAKVALEHFGEILTRTSESLPISPKSNLKQAHASLLLNFAIAARKYGANVDTKLGLLQKICEKISRNEADLKVQIRLIIALGTLIHQVGKNLLKKSLHLRILYCAKELTA